MLEFEQDFYRFVKAQLDKKKGIKHGSEDSNDEEEEVKKNRLQSENIKKVLQNERKKIKINKVSKEQHFENKMKDFAQMDTFIDVKQFLKNLNEHHKKKSFKKPLQSQQKFQSDSDNEDLFDYAEIVQKSKKIIAKSYQYRQKPKITGYISNDYHHEIENSKTEIEEGKTTNEKFYTGIDKLITDINQQNALSEMDQQYEQVKQRHRESLQQYAIEQQFNQIDFGNDENAQNAGKKFKEQSKKVLQLLEKTSKMLFNGRMAKPQNQKLLKKKVHISQDNNENNNSKLILYKSRSQSKEAKEFKLPNLVNPMTRKVGQIQHLSHSTLPEIKPISLISGRDDKNKQLHYFRTPNNKVENYQNNISNNQNNVSNHSVSIYLKNQFGDFITQVDTVQEQFLKMYPSDSQIQKIQSNMTINMNKIGKTPLESLKYLTKRKMNFNKNERKPKKSKLLQII